MKNFQFTLPILHKIKRRTIFSNFWREQWYNPFKKCSFFDFLNSTLSLSFYQGHRQNHFPLPIFYNHRPTPLEKRNFFYFLKSCFSCQERLFFYPEYSQHIFFSCLFCPKKKHGKCLILWTKLWTKPFRKMRFFFCTPT